METTIDLFTRINEKYNSLSKGHKKISDYITENYDKCAFMTAQDLAKASNVSESTVVRFAYALGFEGFPELSKNLQELVKNKLSILQRAKITIDDESEYKILENVMKKDFHNIKETLEKMDVSSFENAVNSIVNAKGNVYILGLRTSTSLSEYLFYYLQLMMNNVRLVKYSYTDVFEQIIDVNEDDVVIGISFPRYTSKTYEIISYAKAKKAKILVITDSKKAPIASFADYMILAHSNMSFIVDSLTAPLSIINAMIVAIGIKKKEEVEHKFEDFENVCKKQKIFID